MKERHNEINIHKEMLNAQVRAVNEERQQISAELHERISKIDKLRKRYKIVNTCIIKVSLNFKGVKLMLHKSDCGPTELANCVFL